MNFHYITTRTVEFSFNTKASLTNYDVQLNRFHAHQQETLMYFLCLHHFTFSILR